MYILSDNSANVDYNVMYTVAL